MERFRYILEPYKGSNSRYECPACGKRKSFALYIDTDNNEHVHSDVGRCNRESACAYHLTPKQYFEHHRTNTRVRAREGFSYTIKRAKIDPLPEIIIEPTIMKKSLTGYEKNHFVSYLISLFGKGIAYELVAKYFIGTSKYWQGSTVFWQINTKGKIKTAKIMLYNPETGKRVKKPFNHIQWAHKLTKREGKLIQSFFGEHLLRDKSKTVAVAESEKTAIVASVYFPEFIWLACGGLSLLSHEKCHVLKGRNVILYPDLNGFEKWTEKADLFLPKITKSYSVSRLLENVATEDERKQGLDLADYLIRYNAAEFRQNVCDILNDNTKDGIDNQDTPETLKFLLRELTSKIPENTSIVLDSYEYPCFKTVIKMVLEGWETNPKSKFFKERIIEIMQIVKSFQLETN